MTFYVIGNGFDLHYKLPTSYNYFKMFLLDNGYGELVEKVDILFDNHMLDPNDIETWSDFENMLQVFNDLDCDEIFDEAMENAQDDDERADYFDSPAWNVDYYNEYIKVLKDQFVLWIKSIDTKIHKDAYFNPADGDFVLTFNYTNTIKNNFYNNSFSIYHIHGSSNEPLVLGHNSYQDPYCFNITWDEDSDYRSLKAQEEVNGVLKSASELYYKNSRDIIRRNCSIFESIKCYDKVVFMGLSCGAQDSMYVDEIIKHANAINFYYYDDKAKEKYSNITCAYRIETNFCKW